MTVEEPVKSGYCCSICRVSGCSKPKCLSCPSCFKPPSVCGFDKTDETKQCRTGAEEIQRIQDERALAIKEYKSTHRREKRKESKRDAEGAADSLAKKQKS